MRHFFYAAAFLVLAASAAPAQTTRATTQSRVVGTVLGQAITAADVGIEAPIDTTIKFDARDEKMWAMMSRVSAAFSAPLMQRFIEESKIELTEEEIRAAQAKFSEGHRETLKRAEKDIAAELKRLEDPNLLPHEREKAKKALESARNQAQAMQVLLKGEGGENQKRLAAMFILPWKIERELHRKYGGRVIFQQAGPEALDARRKLFEAAEAAGDLKFDDPGVRHLFYYYSHMPHTFIKEDALAKPWFLKED